MIVGRKNETSDSNSNVVGQLLERDEVCVSEHASGIAEQAGGELLGVAKGRTAVKAEFARRASVTTMQAKRNRHGNVWLAPLKLLGRRVEEPHALGVWD